MKYITRFTEDCFASLVAAIFIYDAIREILKIRKLYPVNYRPNLLLDYSCSCLFTDINDNETNINDTNLVDYLFHGDNLNKTSQIACVHAGGFVVGSGCSTPVYHADIFFYSVILFSFTFLICMFLQDFRQSSFFPSKVKRNKKFESKSFCFFRLDPNASRWFRRSHCDCDNVVVGCVSSFEYAQIARSNWFYSDTAARTRLVNSVLR